MSASPGPTVLLGFLAGVITLAGLVVTRGNIISAFRQAWINDQRSDLAIITSKATIISSNISSDMSKDFESFTAAMSRIRLRENPDNPEWSVVLRDIAELRNALWVNRGSHHDVTNLIDAIDLNAQRPLKDNWTRTSEGEKRDISALKWVRAMAIVIAILLLASFFVPLALGSEESNDDTAGQKSGTRALAAITLRVDNSGQHMLRSQCTPPNTVHQSTTPSDRSSQLGQKVRNRGANHTYACPPGSAINDKAPSSTDFDLMNLQSLQGPSFAYPYQAK